MKEMTFKLYSPLTAELILGEMEDLREDELQELSGKALIRYAEEISKQIEREGANLEPYIDAEDAPYLAAHVKSIRISVEERGGNLCGCATVVVDENLTERRWNDLLNYITGQYSDGWGEGFEQCDIDVEDGVLNVHFWQPMWFAFTIEQVANEPPFKQAEPEQPAKKYEITDVAHPDYPELHRIRALRRVRADVPAGAFGGYVQSEANLSQGADEAWLYNNAISRDDAVVCGNAQLHNRARATGGALITGSASVFDDATVEDEAIVCAGTIRNYATICGKARIRVNAETRIEPSVLGSSTVMGELAGAVTLNGFAFIHPGQTVDNPTYKLISIQGRESMILCDLRVAYRLPPDHRGKHHNNPER